MNKYLIFSALLCFFAMTFQSCDETEEPLPYENAAKPTFASIDGVVGYLDFVNIENAQTGFTLNQEGEVNANSFDIYAAYKPAPDSTEATSYGDRELVRNVSDIPSDQIFTAEDLAQAVGLEMSDLNLGDAFRLSFQSQTSEGPFESNEFLYVDVSCPSDIGGPYNAVSSGQSTDDCCPDPAVDIMAEGIELIDNGSGIYTINDFSGGLWFHWYEVYGATSANPGEIKDVCNTITFQNTTELFGSNISGTGSVDPETGIITIEWLADSWGDAGTTVLTPAE